MKKFDIFTKENLKKLILITIGSILVSLGIYYFIMGYSIPLGGISGFAIGFNYLFPELQVGLIMTILNLILFVISYIFLGKEYVGFTIYSALIVSLGISFLENRFPLNNPLTDNILLSLIIGVFISGVGIAIVIMQNATTGGTEIIASIIHKYTNLEMGKSLLLIDFLVVVFGIFAINIESGLYAFVGIGLNTIIIDWAISGLNTRINMIIITENVEVINDFIIGMDRGSTLYVAKGGYSKKDKIVINTILSRAEYFLLKKYISNVDPEAFVMMNYTNEVLGEGFNSHNM